MCVEVKIMMVVVVLEGKGGRAPFDNLTENSEL